MVISCPVIECNLAVDEWARNGQRSKPQPGSGQGQKIGQDVHFKINPRKLCGVLCCEWVQLVHMEMANALCFRKMLHARPRGWKRSTPSRLRTVPIIGAALARNTSDKNFMLILSISNTPKQRARNGV